MQSLPKENTYDNQELRRLRTVLLNYNSFLKTDLRPAVIAGRYGFYLKELCNRLSPSIEKSIESMAGPKISEESSSRFLESALLGLSEYYHLISEVTQGVSDIPKSLYFFADEMFDGLDGREIPYIIRVELKETIPYTYELCRDIAKKHLINFPYASKYLMKKKLHTICLSPIVVDNPLDWVLIAHEIAHILEKETLKIVQKKYRQLREPRYLATGFVSDSNESLDTYEPEWSLELMCDVLATIAFGPIYGFRLMENYQKRHETKISPTHPFWKIRFRYIAEELSHQGWKIEATRIREEIRRIKLDSVYADDFIPGHWKAIQNSLRLAMKSHKMEYPCDPHKRKTVNALAKRLEKLSPCITFKGEPVDPRDLLNAAEYVAEKIKLSEGFREFLGDMLRLTAAEKSYVKLKSVSSSI